MAIDRNGNYMPDSFPEEAKKMYGAKPVIAPMSQEDFLSHTTGAKREKLAAQRYDYMPHLEVNEAFARVATFGAQKYDTDNWMKGLPISQLFGSLMRHCWKFMAGETYDSDSGLKHTDHILWNAVAMVYFVDKMPEMDDRFPNRLADSEKER